ncbi:MAG: delta-60 repeat domain-containing protein [Xanthomonadales bacterium]|nr:delta-60 repeat domain-containing protein [Xanthomonadales bacterium]
MAVVVGCLCSGTVAALDSTLETSFGIGGQRMLSYQPSASNEADEGLAILRDGFDRRIVIVVRRNPTPLDPLRPFELMLFRDLADGSVDTSFGSGHGFVRVLAGWTEFRGALIDSQNRILVAGTILDGTAVGAASCVMRLLADGGRDLSFTGGVGNEGIACYLFGSSAANRMVAVTQLPSGDLVSAANLDQGNGDLLLQRISGTNGAPVTTWGDGFGFKIIDLQPGANAARDTVVGLSTLADGRVLALAQSCTVALGCLPAAAQLTATTGQLDTSFCASSACIAASVAGANSGRRVVRNLQIDGQTVTDLATTVVLRDGVGRIVLGGQATLASAAAERLLFVRLNANGELDSSFGAPATPGFQNLALSSVPLTPSSLALDALGRLVVGGQGEHATLRRIFIARMGDNGQLDAGFGGASALVEYFAAPAADDRALRALGFDGARILGVGDFNGSANRDAFLFRLGGNPDALFVNGFEG